MLNQSNPNPGYPTDRPTLLPGLLPVFPMNHGAVGVGGGALYVYALWREPSETKQDIAFPATGRNRLEIEVSVRRGGQATMYSAGGTRRETLHSPAGEKELGQIYPAARGRA